MSGFNTKVKNNYGEYEITFYTKNRKDFEKVQDLCRKLIDHNKLDTKKGSSEDVFTRKEELSKEESEWLIDFITKDGNAE